MESMMNQYTAPFGYNKNASLLNNQYNTDAFRGFAGANTFAPSWPSTFFGGAAHEQYPFGERSAQWPMTNDFEGSRRFPSTWSSSWGERPSFEGRHRQFDNAPSSWAAWPSTSFEGRHHFDRRSASPSSSSWFNNAHSEESMTRRHHLPSELRDVAFRPASIAEYESLCNPIAIHPIDGSRLLRLCFDVKGFKPEECNVTVSLKERCFTVEAKHEVKDNKEHAVTRTYLRKYTIPAEYCCDLTKITEKEIKSCFTHDGLLVLEARLPCMTAEELKCFREKSQQLLANKATLNNLPIYGESCNYGRGTHACSIPVKTVA